MKKLLLCFLIVLFSTAATIVQAQTTVSGTVKDSDGGGLPGVNVFVKGTVLGTITDGNGNFNLTVKTPPPFTLVVSSIGFDSQEFEITGNQSGLEVTLNEGVLTGEEIVVTDSRVPDDVMKSPIAVERLDILAIRQSAAPSFYDGLRNIKGIDVSTQSLTFSSVNARGFGANGNVRMVQLIDGVDNQAPGLNFSAGNIVGISELDLESVNLLPGAASASYGPNALNGILLMNSKSPFEYQGLSATAKLGVNHIDGEDDDPSLYQNYAIRYAKAFNNKFAFKVNFSYLRANDFRAVDTRDQSFLAETGATERGDNRIYNGVNVYGETLLTPGAIADIQINDPNTDPLTRATLQGIRTLLPDGAAGAFTPDGFTEASFVDNTTESMKVNAALHYRVTEKIEAIAQFNYGLGSTVYTANDRFVLDNFSIWTGKLELRGNNFFLRGYTTRESSGDTYAADATAARINLATFVPAYFQTFAGARTQGATTEQAHALARVAGRAAQPQPGSAAFNQLFNEIRSIPISEGGSKFLDETSMWHFEGMYNFKELIDPSTVEITVGGNFRRYNLDSQGTLFALDNDGEEISFNEFGFYTQLEKSFLDDNLNVSASVRYDKNENFEGQFSPRVSAVYTLLEDHNIRLSFQRGFRIPTTQDQFIDLDVGDRRLIGSNQLLIDRYNFQTNPVYLTQDLNAVRAGTLPIDQLQAVQFDDFTTEKVNTFEIGYRSLINNKLSIDAYYYYSVYQDFIAEVDFTQGVPNGLRQDPASPVTASEIVNQTVPLQRYGFDINADGNVEVQGFAIGADYALPKGYVLASNVSYNNLISQQDLIDQGFLAQFNTPEWSYNVKLSNRNVYKNMGFNIVWRWQDAFLWESAFGTGIIPAFGTLDAQVSLNLPKIGGLLKIGGSNLLNERYTTSFGNPRLGGLYYVSFTFDQQSIRK